MISIFDQVLMTVSFISECLNEKAVVQTKISLSYDKLSDTDFG